MKIPTQKFYLKNLSADLFHEKDEEDIALFLEQYGTLITSLRVDQLSVCFFGKELNFLEALVNLQELEAGHFSYGVQTKVGSHLTDDEEEKMAESSNIWFDRLEQDVHYSPDEPYIPAFIKRLKVLKIGQERNVWRLVRETMDRTALRYWGENKTTLEHISLPFVSHTMPLDPLFLGNQLDPRYKLDFILSSIQHDINSRAKVNRELPKARVMDFVNFHDSNVNPNVHLTAAITFPNLLRSCVENGIKLRNVSSLWFVSRIYIPQRDPRWDWPCLGLPIVSMVGLHPCVLSLDMPNLEAIKIPATSTSSVGQYWREERVQWPALKYLSITVDSKKSEHFVHENPNAEVLIAVDTKSLFQFFFQDVSRPELTALCFQFTKEAGDVAIPNVKHIVGACPNLKKLSLVNWPGTNKALLELFRGLSELEEVTLEGCKNLGNVAFVGLDTSRPLFQTLSKLKRLSLKGLDKMPKITDLLFAIVIRHLKLTHFTLASGSPLKSVTTNGIRALLEGEFSQSIEKFPFLDWSLDGVSLKEFSQLETRFRAHNML